jgi:HK97 family phage portal protein
MYDNSPPPPPGSKLWYQYFPINSETVILPASDVLHIKGLSSNGIVGRNVIQLMRESVGISMATEEQGARLFSNGAQIGKIFKHPAKLSNETFERLKNQLDKYSGAENAHKTIILEQGMDIETTTMTMEDAQFLDTRKFQVEDIASFLDVPLILINRSGDKNQTYASAEQVISIFITHQMAPDFVAWEQNLNQKLLYQSEINAGIYFRFDFDAMLRGDTKARAEYLMKRFNMGSMNPDQIRVYEDENPTGTKEGKEYYVQAGVQPVSLIGKMPVANPLAKSVDEKPVDEKPVAPKEDNKNGE